MVSGILFYFLLIIFMKFILLFVAFFVLIHFVFGLPFLKKGVGGGNSRDRNDIPALCLI